MGKFNKSRRERHPDGLKNLSAARQKASQKLELSATLAEATKTVKPKTIKSIKKCNITTPPHDSNAVHPRKGGDER